MKDGKFCCQNTIPKLKEEFAVGYNITVKTIENKNLNSKNVDLKNEILNTFETLQFKDEFNVRNV